MGLIKTGQFIDKSKVKITYDIYLMPFSELKDFLDKNESLISSFIELINEQFNKTTHPLILTYLSELAKDLDISNFYSKFFLDKNNDKILFSIMKDPNNGFKITEIGSTAVFVNKDFPIIKIWNVYIIEKYRGNKLCPIIMNVIIEYLFNETTYKLITGITLDVLHDNDKAIGCYKKLGFEIDTIKGIQTVNSEKYYGMNLNFKSYFIYLIKLKILELLESGSQKLKDQINVLFTKL